MSEPQPADVTRLEATALFVCDARGRLQAVSSKTAANKLFDSAAAQMHIAEVFGPDSDLTRWLMECIDEARERDEYCAESRLEADGKELLLRIESLKQDNKLYGFAVLVLPASESSKCAVLNEGDAIVSRQQWHDIKNHLGGLKLYATFLRKKLPVGDDQKTVEKMLHGIDGLIEHLAKIRRGEVQ